MTTALIYTRVSTDEQARDGLSLDAQLADCRRYAAQFGWAIGGEYQDVLTGKRDDRPQYQTMLAEALRLAADGHRVVIVVKWLHLLGRRVLERVRCREELKALGVALHSIAEGGEVSDLVANILASVAEEEVRQLSERVRSVHQHVTANGWTTVGAVLWGYKWKDATGAKRASGAPRKVLEVDSDTAPYVREAFERVAAGATIHSVQRWLISLPTDVRGGRRMSYQALRFVLMCPTYKAKVRGPDGVLISGHWPALVDEALWERVQASVATYHHVPHQASGTHLLTGLLRCGRCGARMVGIQQRDSRARTFA